MFLEGAHDENIGKVQRFLCRLIQGVNFDGQHIFLGEVHMEMKNGLCFEKGR